MIELFTNSKRSYSNKTSNSIELNLLLKLLLCLIIHFDIFRNARKLNVINYYIAFKYFLKEVKFFTKRNNASARIFSYYYMFGSLLYSHIYVYIYIYI